MTMDLQRVQHVFGATIPNVQHRQNGEANDAFQMVTHFRHKYF